MRRRYTIDVPPEWLSPRINRLAAGSTVRKCRAGRAQGLTATLAEWAIEGQVRRVERQQQGQQDLDDDGS